jgi:hypothetical protein
MRRSRAPLSLALVAVALAAGCAAPGTDLEALPFYREDRTTPAITLIDVPLALLSYDHFEAEDIAPVASYAVPEGEPPPDEDLTILRLPWPFGAWVNDGTRRYYTLTAFIGGEGIGTAGPLGRATATAGDVRARPFAALSSTDASGGAGTLPFVFYDTFIDHDALGDAPTAEQEVGDDHDLGLLPLFSWGDGSSEEHDYFAVAPFGGTTKGLIGKERITWFGFPYPLYAHVEDRAYDSHHVLWPLVNWVDGPLNDGFRILPFYAHYERKNQEGHPLYDRTWLLWPLITWQTESYPGERPTETFFAFPFYGQIRGPSVSSTTVLFPFFKYTETEFPERWELRAPFPILQIAGGPDYWKFDLWPLFGLKERGDSSRQFALWPIFRHEAMEYDHASFDGWWFLPFFWTTDWYHKEHDTHESTTRVWPLLHYRRTPGDTVDFAALSLWWWDDVGFERTLGAFTRLYHYHRDPDGGVEHQALLGAFSWRDLPALEEVDRPAYWRLSLLFGLFHLRSLGGESGLRLFWLPEITWGQRDAGDTP